MVSAAATVANDGMWIAPHIIQRDAPVTARQSSRRVISTQTAARMQRLMETVVATGTGTKAQPKGYSAAGKTGTAQKVDPLTHTYAAHDFIASFVGFTPVESPQLAMIVVLDSPRGEYHGGTVAAPVFRKIAEQVLAYRNVPPTNAVPQLPVSLASFKKKPTHDSSEPVDLEESATQFVDAGAGLVVPDFVGQDVRAVTAKALASRLPIEIDGTGIAFAQEPAAGELLPEGSKISIHFHIGAAAGSVSSPPKLAQPAPKRSSIPTATAAALPASG
jgi:cell division protein FtsI (penicillin-binding protein 3)